jgi:hypothetical protein
LLLTGNRECARETRFCFRRIRLRRLKGDFACNAIDLGLESSFFGSFDRAGGFANAAPSIIDLFEIGMRNRQIR